MTQKPKVLFLSQILPYPLDSGPRIRTFFVLKHLTANYDITLVAFIRSEDEMKNVGPLSELCQVHPVLFERSLTRDATMALRSLITGEPFMIIRHQSERMRQTIKDLMAAQDFDLIHVDQIKTAQYVEGITTLPRLIDKHNVYAHIVKGVAEEKGSPFKRWLARLEWPKLARYEGRVCREFDHVLAVTEEDKQALAQLAGTPCSITVVPIATAPDTVGVVQRQPDARDIVSVGSMFYPPNVEGVLWFADEVYPLIKAQLPDVKLYLIGSRPARAIRRLGERDPSIVVTGYVEDLAPYLARSAVMIAPLHFGSGMRVKILDSLARGMPLVSTPFGCQGIHVTHDENILIADAPEDFAAMVQQVIEDRDVANRLATNGRRLMETEYHWRVVYRALDDVYQRMINGRVNG